MPEPPVVTIIHGLLGKVMTLEELQGSGLLAEPEPVSHPPRVSRSSTGRAWPDYARCVQGAPLERSGLCPRHGAECVRGGREGEDEE
jgi:hypothetical protein